MMGDSPLARSPATAMRDLLRQLDRQTIKPPARPTQPPASVTAFAALSATETAEPPSVQIGSWTLAEDPASGDLVATNADGTVRTLATKGPA